jgi:hypothetical protein
MMGIHRQERDCGGRAREIDFLEDTGWQRVRVNLEPDLQCSRGIHVLLHDLVQVKRVGLDLLVAEGLEAEHALAFRDNH